MWPSQNIWTLTIFFSKFKIGLSENLKILTLMTHENHIRWAIWIWFFDQVLNFLIFQRFSVAMIGKIRWKIKITDFELLWTFTQFRMSIILFGFYRQSNLFKKLRKRMWNFRCKENPDQLGLWKFKINTFKSIIFKLSIFKSIFKKVGSVCMQTPSGYKVKGVSFAQVFSCFVLVTDYGRPERK